MKLSDPGGTLFVLRNCKKPLEPHIKHVLVHLLPHSSTTRSSFLEVHLGTGSRQKNMNLLPAPLRSDTRVPVLDPQDLNLGLVDLSQLDRRFIPPRSPLH